MKLIKLPGLIDPHVHLRDPGATQKEDFLTGTQAALAGGIVVVLDMPNNPEPTITFEALQEKRKNAKAKAVCDYGFFFGASQEDNIDQFSKVEDEVAGLKVTMDSTTGVLLLEKLEILKKVFEKWPSQKPILVHAEDSSLAKAIGLATIYNRRLHICHVSQRSELELIIKAKEKWLPITCEVTPHHLFLTERDAQKLAGFGKMRPPLRPQKDVDYLWENLGAIDCLVSDHAPHTIEEKKSDNPPNGVPGLETSLPLMLTAVSEGRIKLEEIIRLMSKGPGFIYNLFLDSNTFIEIDPEKRYTIENKNLFTKCGWSPFAGMQVKGKVIKTVIRGVEVFADDEIKAKKGFGQELRYE